MVMRNFVKFSALQNVSTAVASAAEAGELSRQAVQAREIAQRLISKRVCGTSPLYCHADYTITTANGQARKFWERNLRLKTDASSDGPEKKAPALVRAGMMGDRADVIFAERSEISSLIVAKCE